MITAILAAVGIGPEPELSHAERAAKLAQAIKANEAAVAANTIEHNAAIGAFNSAKSADTAKRTAEHDAFEHQKSLEVAEAAKAELLPLFAKWHEQPSRKTALAIQAAIRSIRTRVENDLGTDLDPVFIASAMASTFLESDSDLYSVFSAIDAYTGDPISAATYLVQHADSLYVSATEAALTRLEQSIEHLARTAPRSPRTDSYVAQHTAMTAHAVRSRRSAAVEALRHAPVAAAVVQPAAEPKKPVAVEPKPAVTKVEVSFTDDAHFAKIAASMPELNRI